MAKPPIIRHSRQCPVCYPVRRLLKEHRAKKNLPDPEQHRDIKDATGRQRPVQKNTEQT